MQMPNIPVALRLAAERGLDIDREHTTYYVGRETVIPKVGLPGMKLWREKLFAILSHNPLSATAFYRLPSDRVMEIGIQVDI
jgi:KUP system potassium uptake protein